MNFVDNTMLDYEKVGYTCYKFWPYARNSLDRWAIF